MPQAIALLIEYIFDYAVSYEVAYAIAEVIVVVALDAAAQALLSKPKSPQQAPEINYVSTEAPLIFAYGSVRCGGMETIPPITTNVNGNCLHRVISHCGHAVDSMTDVTLDQTVILDREIAAITGTSNDGAVTASTLATPGGYYNSHGSFLRLRRKTGVSTETVDYILNSIVSATAFPSTFIGKGICKTIAEFVFDPNVFQGIPNMVTQINGKLLYDPRLDSTNGGSGSQRYTDSTTWTWSNNPALCIADYLMSPYGGAYDPTADINWADVIAAANTCDTIVAASSPATPGGWGYTNATGSTASGHQVITKSTATNAWDGGGYSSNSFFRGSISMSVPVVTNTTAIGLAPTQQTNLANMTYAIEMTYIYIYIYEAGVQVAAIAHNVLLTDVVRIDFDGTFIRYWLNGKHLRTSRIIDAGIAYTTQLYECVGIYNASASVNVDVDRRFQTDGLLPGNAKLTDNLGELLKSMMGKLTYANGVWRMFAGSWQAPTLTINDTDWCSYPSYSFDGGRVARFNRSRAWFLDRMQNWQRQEAYVVSNATYYAADGNEWIDNQTDFKMVMQDHHAQRLSNYILAQSRDQVTISGKLFPRWQQLNLWDTVAVNNALFGWVTKTFRVIQCTIGYDGAVDVVLREEYSTDWTDLTTANYGQPSNATINPVNPTVASAPTSLSIAETINGTLQFGIGPPVVMPLGMRYQVLQANTSVISPASATVIYDGVGLNPYVPIATPFGQQNYYWAATCVGSTFGATYPTTVGMPWTNLAKADNTLNNAIVPDADIAVGTPAYWTVVGSAGPSSFQYVSSGGNIGGYLRLSMSSYGTNNYNSYWLRVDGTPHPNAVSSLGLPLTDDYRVFQATVTLRINSGWGTLINSSFGALIGLAAVNSAAGSLPNTWNQVNQVYLPPSPFMGFAAAQSTNIGTWCSYSQLYVFTPRGVNYQQFVRGAILISPWGDNVQIDIDRFALTDLGAANYPAITLPTSSVVAYYAPYHHMARVQISVGSTGFSFSVGGLTPINNVPAWQIGKSVWVSKASSFAQNCFVGVGNGVSAASCWLVNGTTVSSMLTLAGNTFYDYCITRADSYNWSVK